MGKTIFAELDEITFNRIKTTKNMSGMIDEKKFFSKMNEGDSIVFSCRGKKIEAYLKKIKIYNTISDYLHENKEIGVLEINSKNPINILSMLNTKSDGFVQKETKRIRIYEVDYHPYGEDDNDNEEKHHDDNGIAKFIEALMNNANYKDCCDNDEF